MPHPCIFLWTHPRSVSSALEFCMRQRGDLQTLHEPFMYLYYLGEAHKSMAHFQPDPQHPADYAGIKAMILRAAEDGPVFVKDMAYYVTPRISDDIDFLRTLTHSYLIRDPRRSIPSYYRLDPSVTCEEIGLEALYRHYCKVTEISAQAPIIIDADDLTTRPQATLRAYCKALDLPFIARALHWDQDALPADWTPVAAWHRDLQNSSSLGGPGGPPPAKTSLDDAPALRAFYQHHAPYYQKLHALRLRPAD